MLLYLLGSFTTLKGSMYFPSLPKETVDVGLNQARSARQCVSFPLTAIASSDVISVANGYVHRGCAKYAQQAESPAASAALLLSCLDASYPSTQSLPLKQPPVLVCSQAFAMM